MEFYNLCPSSNRSPAGRLSQYNLQRSCLFETFELGKFEMSDLPAQLIKMSKPPNFSATAVFISRSCMSIVKSHCTTRACDGKFLPILSSSAMSLPTSATFAPLFRYQYARVLPIPEDAPVMTTDLLRKYPGCFGIFDSLSD